MNNKKIRQFDGGATRDTDVGKLDFEGFLSPLVLKRYARYLSKHRVQSDGNLRDSDNWQSLFGEKHFDICIKSAFRHFIDWWLEHRKCGKSENGIEDAICAVMFNAQAYLLKILKDKQQPDDDCVIKELDDFYFIYSLVNGYLWRDLRFHACIGSGRTGNVQGYFSTREEAEDCLRKYKIGVL